MGHNDGTNNAHSLEQLLSPTAWAVGQENALQHLHLRWPHHHILGNSGKGHYELLSRAVALCQWRCPTGHPCQPLAGKGVSPAPAFTS